MFETKYTNKQKGLLWWGQLASLCAMILWLINPISQSIYILLAFVVTWLISTTLIYGVTFFRQYLCTPMLKMFFWIIVLFFYWLMDHVHFSLSYIMYFFLFGIGTFYFRVRDKMTCYAVCVVSMIYLILITISTLQAYTMNPAISRILARGDYEEIVKLGGADFVTPFIAGYSVIYGLVFVCAALISFIHSSNILFKAISIVLLVAFSSLIIQSQYMIAIILLITSFFLSFIEKRKAQNGKILATLLFLFVITFLLTIGPILLNWLASFSSVSDNISLRLKQIANMLMGQIDARTDLSERCSEYGISITSFFLNPFFGVGTKISGQRGIGEHSTILDAFAQYGLVGGIPYLWFYVSPLQGMLYSASVRERRPLRVIIIILLLLALFNIANTRADFACIYLLTPLMIQLSTFVNDNKKK